MTLHQMPATGAYMDPGPSESSFEPRFRKAFDVSLRVVAAVDAPATEDTHALLWHTFSETLEGTRPTPH